MQNLVTKYNTPDATYPDGSAKNDAVAGDKTGTELVKPWVDELLQTWYAIIRHIGHTPDNVFERPGTSQNVRAIQKWMNRNALMNFRDLQNAGFLATKTAIERNDDYFVMVGGGGNIRTSLGGEEWLAAASGTGNDFYDIEFDETNLIFLAVGDGGTIRTQTDPTAAWVTRTPSTEMTGADIFGCDCDLNGIVYCNVGNGNTNSYAIDISIDQGLIWEDIIFDLGGSITGLTTETPQNVSVKSGVGLAVCDGGKIIRTPNAQTNYNWATVTTPNTNDLFDIDYSSLLGMHIAVGSEALWTSIDGGLTWVDRTANLPADISGEILYGINWMHEANVWIACGTKTFMFISADGINWYRIITTGTPTLYDTVFRSTNGTGICCGTSADVLQSAGAFPLKIAWNE
jgi:hypothetical protein